MKKHLLLLTVLALITGVGCNSKKNEVASETTPVVTTTTETGTPAGGGTDGGLTATGGDTVTFVPVSFSIFNAYVGSHPINSPKNIKINVDLKDNGELRYYGAIRISYEDNGQTNVGTFESGEGKNQAISGGRDNGVMESVYNYWFSKDGKTVFSGFFQDRNGSIVLVIDNSADQGDGQGSTYVSGSVYFKNFPQSSAVQSQYRKCWFIYPTPFPGTYAGPYDQTVHDCRSGTVMTKSALYPTTAEGYRKLGTFSGLKRATAFNIE